MRKLVITGPESTGKTTLAKQLSKNFNLPLVNEFARSYLEKTNGAYEYDDLELMAQGQMLQEQEYESHELVICDTDILTFVIWARFKFQKVPPFITETYAQVNGAAYLLCYPDLPWSPDPLRENPNDLIQLFQEYENELIQKKANYYIITGKGDTRLQKAQNILKILI